MRFEVVNDMHRGRNRRENEQRRTKKSIEELHLRSQTCVSNKIIKKKHHPVLSTGEIRTNNNTFTTNGQVHVTSGDQSPRTRPAQYQRTQFPRAFAHPSLGNDSESWLDGGRKSRGEKWTRTFETSRDEDEGFFQEGEERRFYAYYSRARFWRRLRERRDAVSVGVTRPCATGSGRANTGTNPCLLHHRQHNHHRRCRTLSSTTTATTTTTSITTSTTVAVAPTTTASTTTTTTTITTTTTGAPSPLSPLPSYATTTFYPAHHPYNHHRRNRILSLYPSTTIHCHQKSTTVSLV